MDSGWTTGVGLTYRYQSINSDVTVDNVEYSNAMLDLR